MRLQTLPIEKVLILINKGESYPTKYKHALANLRKQDIISDNLRISCYESVPKSKHPSAFDLIVVYGSYCDGGHGLKQSVHALTMMLKAGLQHKLMIVTSNKAIWEKTCEWLEIPLISYEKLGHELSECLLKETANTGQPASPAKEW